MLQKRIVKLMIGILIIILLYILNRVYENSKSDSKSTYSTFESPIGDSNICFSNAECKTGAKCIAGSCVNIGEAPWEGQGSDTSFTCVKTGKGNFATEMDCYQMSCKNIGNLSAPNSCCGPDKDWRFAYDFADKTFKCYQKDVGKGTLPTSVSDKLLRPYCKCNNISGSNCWFPFKYALPLAENTHKCGFTYGQPGLSNCATDCVIPTVCTGPADCQAGFKCKSIGKENGKTVSVCVPTNVKGAVSCTNACN